jgi:hypothetical protein
MPAELIKKSSSFLEPVGSLLYSQEPITGPYLEIGESDPFFTPYFTRVYYFNIALLSTPKPPKRSLSFRLPTKMYLSFFPWVLHVLPVTVAVRSEAWVLAGWLLGSWVRVLLKVWMFVPCLSVLCCPV